MYLKTFFCFRFLSYLPLSVHLIRLVNGSSNHLIRLVNGSSIHLIHIVLN
jgi:hypothetical protein